MPPETQTTANPAPADRSIRAVVFDMGGVIVRLGPISDILGAGGSNEEQWAQWLANPAVRAFEMGLCDAEEFGRRMVEDLELGVSPGELVERFASWPRGLERGAAILVQDLPEDIEVCLLSNTNALHWYGQTDHEKIRSLFDRTYLSFELAMAKPDDAIFQHVVDDLAVAGASVLFLDDNQINVDAARRVGLRAETTRGVVEAREAIAAYGLLDQ